MVVYKGLGAVDRDLNQRLTRMRIEIQWLNEWTAIYHQWHAFAKRNQ